MDYACGGIRTRATLFYAGLYGMHHRCRTDRRCDTQYCRMKSEKRWRTIQHSQEDVGGAQCLWICYLYTALSW